MNKTTDLVHLEQVVNHLCPGGQYLSKGVAQRGRSEQLQGPQYWTGPWTTPDSMDVWDLDYKRLGFIL